MEPLPPGDPEKNALPEGRALKQLMRGPIIVPTQRKLPSAPEPPEEAGANRRSRRHKAK